MRALADFGIARAELTLIANRHNDVIRVDAARSQRLVLRLQNNVLTDVQAKSQVEWMEAIAKGSQVKTPAPMRTLDNRPFTQVRLNGVRRRVVLLSWLPGCTPDPQTDLVFQSAARMIARLHDHAERFQPQRGFACRRLDEDWLFGERFFIRADKGRRHLTASHPRIATSAEKLTRRSMESLGESPDRFGVIHGDLNLSNIIFYRGRPSPIDFDEFGEGWYLFD